MGCYRCGSEEGSESQLCPTCAQIRKAERATLADGKVPKRFRSRSIRGGSRLVDHIAFDQKTVLILCGALITLFLGFRLVMYHLSAPSLPPDRLNLLYERCLDGVRAQLRAQVNSVAEGTGSDEAFRDVITEILSRGVAKAGSAEAICGFLREECRTNSLGAQCRSGVKTFLGSE